ncbi:hypothetical protein WMF45_44105 [Sorangium sp. So ce448]|uniref:hypothetical protein n=1 Tax=Sorangium sp. So ce448 TaxID=3133314 RepID=UPI003F60D5DD
MRKPLGITMFICALSLYWSGCAAPCPVIPEPGCDRRDPNHHCRDVCVDEVRVDEGEESEDAQEPDAPSEDDQAEGQPSDEAADASKG